MAQAFAGEAPISEEAQAFAASVQTILGIVKPAIDALAAIGEFTGVDDLDDQLMLFQEQVTAALAVLANMVTPIEEETLGAITRWATAVNTLIGIITPGYRRAGQAERLRPRPRLGEQDGQLRPRRGRDAGGAGEHGPARAGGDRRGRPLRGQVDEHRRGHPDGHRGAGKVAAFSGMNIHAAMQKIETDVNAVFTDLGRIVNQPGQRHGPAQGAQVPRVCEKIAAAILAGTAALANEGEGGIARAMESLLEFESR